VSVTGAFQADQAEALRAAVLSGLGVAILPTFLVGPDVRAGVLQVVFPNAVAFSSTIYALFPAARSLIPKVQVFVDFLAARFRPQPYWDDDGDNEGGKLSVLNLRGCWPRALERAALPEAPGLVRKARNKRVYGSRAHGGRPVQGGIEVKRSTLNQQSRELKVKS